MEREGIREIIEGGGERQKGEVYFDGKGRERKGKRRQERKGEKWKRSR